MNWGMIRGIAQFLAPCGPVFRLLVLRGNDDFLYLYIGASNYNFRANDIVSWSEDGALYWHTPTRSTRFDLLQTGVKI